MSTRVRKSSPPTRMTAIIDDVAAMWSKLKWDCSQFRDIQISYPDESQPLGYAALNVCVSAWTLQQWVARAMKVKLGSAYDRKDLEQSIFDAIPEQRACVDIANTFKHASYEDSKWPGGTVKIEKEEGDEDFPPSYVLYHSSETTHTNGIALNRFEALCSSWWSYLLDSELVRPEQRNLPWEQNKFRAMFGDRHISSVPPASPTE